MVTRTRHNVTLYARRFFLAVFFTICCVRSVVAKNLKRTATWLF